MIKNLCQVILYVNNQESLKFWTEKVGFYLITDGSNGDMKWFEIAPTEDAETSIVLHNQELIAKMEPEMNLDTPSLMFCTEDLDHLYQNLSDNQVAVG